MKIKDLEKVRGLARSLAAVRASHCNHFKDRRNYLYLSLKYDNGRNHDNTIAEYLAVDLSLEGPIAALIDQAYRKKILELESELKLLGVDLSEEEGAVL